jgi:hypothetical protein
VEAGRGLDQLAAAKGHAKGVTQDYVEAARLLGLAAAQCYALAQSSLGLLYSHGKGVAQDYVEAARLLRLAVAQGHALAQYSLGIVYAKGMGVSKNCVKAARLWQLAAEHKPHCMRWEAEAAKTKS